MENLSKLGLSLSELLSSTPDNIKNEAHSVIVLFDSEVSLCTELNRNFACIQTRTYNNDNTHTQKIKQFEGFLYWVTCDCENFKTMWEYPLSLYGASESKFLNIKLSQSQNPLDDAGVCKHLYKILTDKRIMTKLDIRCDKTDLFKEYKEVR